MACPNRRRRGTRGFTLVEILVVLTIAVLVIAMAIPQYQRSVLKVKENVLRDNLDTLRTVIDHYSYDKEKAPQSLQDLVSEGYLRVIPFDPMTGSNQSWQVVMEEASQSVNQSEPGIWDVHSGSDKIGSDGTRYSEW